MKIIYEKLQPKGTFDGKAGALDKSLVVSHVNTFNEMDIPDTGLPLNNPNLADRPVLIYCPGPSRKNVSEESGMTKLEEVVANKSHEVILAGSAIRFLLDGTLNADNVDGVVLSNAESRYLDEMEIEGKSLGNIPIYIAKHCRPSVFEKLKELNANIKPFNSYIEGASQPSDNDVYIATGTGAAIGAVAVMSALGHKDFESIGWDGMPEYAMDLSDFPEYQQKLNDSAINIEIDGKDYALYTGFGCDVPEFIDLVQSYPDTINSLHIHGDSPTAAMLNDNGRLRTNFTNMKTYSQLDNKVSSTHDNEQAHNID